MNTLQELDSSFGLYLHFALYILANYYGLFTIFCSAAFHARMALFRLLSICHYDDLCTRLFSICLYVFFSLISLFFLHSIAFLFVCLFVYLWGKCSIFFSLPPILLFCQTNVRVNLWIAWSLVISCTCIYVRFNAFYHRYWFVNVCTSHSMVLVRFCLKLFGVSHAYNFTTSNFVCCFFCSISLFGIIISLSRRLLIHLNSEYDWNGMQLNWICKVWKASNRSTQFHIPSNLSDSLQTHLPSTAT